MDQNGQFQDVIAIFHILFFISPYTCGNKWCFTLTGRNWTYQQEIWHIIWWFQVNSGRKYNVKVNLNGLTNDILIFLYCRRATSSTIRTWRFDIRRILEWSLIMSGTYLKSVEGRICSDNIYIALRLTQLQLILCSGDNFHIVVQRTWFIFQQQLMFNVTTKFNNNKPPERFQKTDIRPMGSSLFLRTLGLLHSVSRCDVESDKPTIIYNFRNGRSTSAIM